MLAGGLVAAGTIAGSAAAFGPSSQPVPSLTPTATQRLWSELVRRPRVRSLSTAECRPLRAVFYAPTDWRRLTTRLAATPSPCAQYYVSVPPLADNKTQLRSDEAWRIRALGPAFHALAEISVTGWTAWVASTGNSWYEAGVEARRRMATAGYDVNLGDTWALNELSSAVRQGTGNARANMRAFLNGLHDGDGTLPSRPRHCLHHRNRPGDDRSLPLPGAVAGLVRGRRLLERPQPRRPRTGRRRSTATSVTTPFPARREKHGATC